MLDPKEVEAVARRVIEQKSDLAKDLRDSQVEYMGERMSLGEALTRVYKCK